MIKMFNPDNQLDVGMGIADMDFRTLPQVTSALKKRLETENWGYELPPLDYSKNIVAWNKRRYNADVPQGNILNSVGVLDGVTLGVDVGCALGVTLGVEVGATLEPTALLLGFMLLRKVGTRDGIALL